MKKTLIILPLAVLMLSGCASLKQLWSNETVQKITWAGVKFGVNLGLDYAATEFPEYEREIGLAQKAINISYSTVFADPEGSQDIASGITNALLNEGIPQEVVNAIKDRIRKELVGLAETPASEPDETFDPEQGKALAASL